MTSPLREPLFFLGKRKVVSRSKSGGFRRTKTQSSQNCKAVLETKFLKGICVVLSVPKRKMRDAICIPRGGVRRNFDFNRNFLSQRNQWLKTLKLGGISLPRFGTRRRSPVRIRLGPNLFSFLSRKKKRLRKKERKFAGGKLWLETKFPTGVIRTTNSKEFVFTKTFVFVEPLVLIADPAGPKL